MSGGTPGPSGPAAGARAGRLAVSAARLGAAATIVGVVLVSAGFFVAKVSLNHGLPDISTGFLAAVTLLAAGVLTCAIGVASFGCSALACTFWLRRRLEWPRHG